MNTENTLDARERAIVVIAAFTAGGEVDRLRPALAEGLDAGLSINEVKEVLVQMYAYAGFPRSLNGLAIFMAVLEDRRAMGVRDREGRDATSIPADLDRDAYGAGVRAVLSGLDEAQPPAAWQKFSPVIDAFLKQHLFADIFARDVLTHRERELATVAALSNMDGVAGQLAFHMGVAMNAGLTEARMRGLIDALAAKVDGERAAAAGVVLAEVLRQRDR